MRTFWRMFPHKGWFKLQKIWRVCPEPEMRTYIETRRGIKVKTGLLALLVWVAFSPILIPVLMLNLMRLCFLGMTYSAEVASDLIMRCVEATPIFKWFYRKRSDGNNWLKRTGQPIPWDEVKRRVSKAPPPKRNKPTPNNNQAFRKRI